MKKVKRTLLFLAFPSSLSYPAGIDTKNNQSINAFSKERAPVRVNLEKAQCIAGIKSKVFGRENKFRSTVNEARIMECKLNSLDAC